ncbi:MAG: hypothetical protein IIZ57_02420, partial [Solobacterium sp.]|nr:hypothetical protein [Solobacterium sp.]
HDKMHTSAGSEALRNNFAKDDAFVMKQLRKSGAVLLGKTNLSEFARFMNTEIPNGYSSRGGQTKSPFGDDVDPLGSSTGSGVACAMSFCAAAVGTETSGSVISPSLANSIVGMKPTVGLVSRSGIIPINAQDTAGPMGRTVMDTAILLNAMTGEDERDPATMYTSSMIPKDYSIGLDENCLQGKRIGVSIPDSKWYTEEQIEAFRSALKYLEQAGAVLVEGCTLRNVSSNAGTLARPVMLNEFKQYMNAYLSEYCSDAEIRTMTDIIRYNNEHSETALKYGQDILEAGDALSGTLTEKEYLSDKLTAPYEAKDIIDGLMREHHLDAIVCPGASALPPLCGYPIITVPAGCGKDGKPVGLSFIAEAFSERKLLKFAYAFEQISALRMIPAVSKKITD